MEPENLESAPFLLHPPQTVFFDLDDTLCGYWDACKAGLRLTFTEHLLEGFSVNQMIDAWAEAFRAFSPTLKKTGWYETYLQKGEPTRTEQMRLTLAVLGIDDFDLAKKLSHSYSEYRDQNLKLFPGTLTVLTELSARYPLGLLTNGPADIQRQEIATLGIEHLFKWVCIEGEMGRGKPLPEVFRHVEEICGFSGRDVVFVGNSYGHDVLPALNAGWQAVWVRRESDVSPSAAAPEEAPIGGPKPSATIGDLNELRRLFAF